MAQGLLRSEDYYKVRYFEPPVGGTDSKFSADLLCWGTL